MGYCEYGHYKRKMMIFFVLFGISLSTFYKYELEANETGRYIYKDHKNRSRYCSECPIASVKNQLDIERDQEPKCALKDTSGKYYFCKENVGNLPGCGPLPQSVHLTWKTKSGRSASINSRVYEVYYPQCPQPYTPSLHTSQFRCGEQLTWSSNLTGIHCTPKEPEIQIVLITEIPWLVIIISSLAVVVVVILLLVVVVVFKKKKKSRSNSQASSCSSGSKFSRSTAVCNERPKSHDVRTSVMSSCDWSEASPSQDSSIRSPKVPIEHKDLGQSSNLISESRDVLFPPFKGSYNPDNVVLIENPDNTLDIPDFTYLQSSKMQELSTNKKPTLPEGISKHDEELMMTIRVFPSSRDKTSLEYPVFIVQEGGNIWIATNQTVPPKCSLHVYRYKNRLYRGRWEHPFLHGIERVCASDSGIYYWYIEDDTDVRQFQLKVKGVGEDRGSPDGRENEGDVISGKQNLVREHGDYIEQSCSENSLECCDVVSSFYDSETEEKQLLERPLQCSLSIDEVYENDVYKPMLQQMCYCLDSISKYDRSACWPSLAKHFLLRSEAYISSVEWHKRGDPENGPSSLILLQLKSIKNRNKLTVGHIAKFLSNGIHYNEEFLRILKTFHRKCPFCEMIYDR